MKIKINRQALKESVGDTALAFIINMPIGFGIIAFANWLGIIAVSYDQNIQLVLLQNFIFTAVAITRKYYVRIYFYNKSEKALTKAQKSV